MNQQPVSTRKKIYLFLGITLGLSCIFYALILANGGMQGGGGVFTIGLMWSPGVSAILTSLICRQSLKELGWRWGAWRYNLLGYGIPLLYGLLGYSFVWLTGLGRFNGQEMAQQIIQQMKLPGDNPAFSLVIYLLILSTVGVLTSMVSALGEEIGWRGFFVPQLAKITSFRNTALISGLIWSVWHYPILIFGGYNNQAPVGYALVMFTIMVLGISVIFAWLRLKSGSLWSSAILHASHNLFIQAIFTPLTADTGSTVYFIDEFGVVLPVLAVAIAVFLLWKNQSQPLPKESVAR